MTPFDEFWRAYPRRVAKGAARKAWAAAAKREGEDTLLAKCLAALAWQIPTNGWDGGCYTPHPATFLNQERYDDEDPAMAAQARRAVQDAADAEWRERRRQIEAAEDERLRRMREGV